MAEEQIPEFEATKCIFGSIYSAEADPDEDGPFDLPTRDPRAQLQAVLKGGGGIALAYRFMKSDLRRCVRILYVCEQACWTWYTNEIKQTQSPKDGCLYSIRMSGMGWASDPHTFDTMGVLGDAEKIKIGKR